MDGPGNLASSLLRKDGYIWMAASQPDPYSPCYSQVHFLPGERVWEVLHLAVTVLGYPGLQGRTQFVQNLVERLCNAALWLDLVHLQRQSHQWEEEKATSDTQRGRTCSQSCTGLRSPIRDTRGEGRAREPRQSILPFLHCSHTEANTLKYLHKKEVTFAGKEECSEGSTLPIRLRYIVTGGLLCDGIVCVCVCRCVFSCSVVSDSLRPYGLKPIRLLCPWDFPGKKTGVRCYALLQGIFLIQA